MIIMVFLNISKVWYVQFWTNLMQKKQKRSPSLYNELDVDPHVLGQAVDSYSVTASSG